MFFLFYKNKDIFDQSKVKKFPEYFTEFLWDKIYPHRFKKMLLKINISLNYFEEIVKCISPICFENLFSGDTIYKFRFSSYNSKNMIFFFKHSFIFS